jgi:branched-chain amino acid transport system substrate-binding protein
MEEWLSSHQEGEKTLLRRCNMRSFWKVAGMVVLALALTVGLSVQGQAKKQKVIVIGGIYDTTGPTSAVGIPYAAAGVAAEKYINQHGGVHGVPIKLIANDYGYKIPEAVALYKKYKDMGVPCIQGWGTGDTNALKSFITKDKIVYMSASYDANLDDPSKTPYNFFVGTSYSDQIRIAMKFIKETWTNKNRPPKVVFIYPDHPYGKNPIPAGKAMAKELGFEIGPDEIVGLRAIDATSQLLHMKEFNPDWAWIGGTTPSTAVILKDAAKLGIKTKFLINCWGMDENLPKLAGDAANGRAYGMFNFAPFGADVPATKEIRSVIGDKQYTLHFNKEWAAMMVMWEAMKRVKGEITGPKLKAALETLRDFDTGGLTAPVTFTPTDHRPNTKLAIYTVKNGKLTFVKWAEISRDRKYLGW